MCVIILWNKWNNRSLCLDVLRVPCFRLVCPSNSSSMLSNPCHTQSLLAALSLSSFRLSLLLCIHHLLCCCCRPPWQPVAQLWFRYFVPELNVFHKRRRKFPLSFTQHFSGTCSPQCWWNVWNITRTIFFLIYFTAM